MRVGAIDVGTNTTRLLAAAIEGGGYRELDRRLTFTRLGEGLQATGRLQPDAIKRTIDAVADYCSECGELDVSVIRVAATSAVREASNPKDFSAAVAAIAGVEPEVLSGEHEARLSFLGATFGIAAGAYTVCDIGGGSTEFVTGSLGSDSGDGAASSTGGLQARSLPLGVVRLTERFVKSDPIQPDEIAAIEDAIDEAMGEANSLVTPESTRLVGVAGTITSLAAIKLGLTRYVPEATHHSVLSLEDVDRLYRLLAGMTIAQRKLFSSLPEGRADVIVAGAAILHRAMLRWRFKEVLVSEKDILDGLVLEMIPELVR